MSGWGICEYICRGKNEKYKFLLAPIIGIIPLSTVPIFLSFFWINTSSSAWITFIAFAFISLYHFIKNPSSLNKTNYHSLFLFFFIILAACPSLAVIWKAGFLTSTLQSYSSYVIYPANYFLQNPIKEMVQLDYDKPITNMLYEVLGNNEYFGFFFILAAMSSILSISPYKLYLVLCGIMGSFVPICTFIACKEGFKLEKKIALFISFLISINISYFFWPLIGHLPFVTGTLYLILALGFIPSMFKCQNRHDFIFYALILSGLVSNYYILCPYLLGSAIFYVLINLKTFQKNKDAFKKIGAISLLTVLLNPFPWIFIIFRSRELASVTSKFTKNIPRYPYVQELFGFGQHFSMKYDGSFKNNLILLTATILIVFVLAGLYERYKSRNILFLSVFSFIFSLGVYFFAIDFTYQFYKNSIIGVFMLISAIAIGGNFLYKKLNYTLIKISVIAVLLVFIMLNLNTYIKIAIKSSHPIVSKAHINLENISNVISDDKIILVNSRNPTEEAWLSFFLKDNKIKLKGSLEPWGFWIFSPLSGKPNFNFFYDYKIDKIDYTLSHKLPYKNDIVETDYGEIVYKNEDYILSKNIPDPFLLRGWYNIERDKKDFFRWTQKESVVLFNKPDINNPVLHIKGTIPAVYEKPIEITIKINDKLIGKLSSDASLNINKQYLLKENLLKESNNILSLIVSDTFSPNEIWESADLRRLGARIKKIEFIAKE